MRPLPLGAAALVFCVGRTAFPQSAERPAPSPRTTPFHFEAAGFLHKLDHGYGTWRGMDLRLQWASPRFTPFVFASTQTRDVGTTTKNQGNLGAGAYFTLARGVYGIAGVSAAPDDSIVFYPRLRLDATLMVAAPGATGLLLTAGRTEIRYSGDAGGSITSVGPILYLGRGIYSGVARFNVDRASGAHSRSFLLAAQYGTQGKMWIGGSVGGGNEAYQTLGATPFDARYESRAASAFVQRWIARSQGLSLRYDFEHKLHTYTRNGVTLGYFVDF